MSKLQVLKASWVTVNWRCKKRDLQEDEGDWDKLEINRGDEKDKREERESETNRGKAERLGQRQRFRKKLWICLSVFGWPGEEEVCSIHIILIDIWERTIPACLAVRLYLCLRVWLAGLKGSHHWAGNQKINLPGCVPHLSKRSGSKRRGREFSQRLSGIRECMCMCVKGRQRKWENDERGRMSAREGIRETRVK